MSPTLTNPIKLAVVSVICPGTTITPLSVVPVVNTPPPHNGGRLDVALEL